MEDMPDLEASIKEITEAWSTYKNGQDQDAARQRIAKAARLLAEEAEGPTQRLFEFTFNPMLNAAMRIALGAGMLDALPQKGSASADELAKKTGADKELIVRIMRLLCAIRFTSEPEAQQYSHTQLSKMLVGTPNPVKATLEMFSDDIYPTVAYLPEHLKRTKYREPTKPAEGPYQGFYKTSESFYDHISKQPGHTENFALAMTANSAASFDLAKYPFPEKLPAAEDEIVLVDCGGGKGQVLRELNSLFPAWHGKKLLQDRADVLEGLKDEESLDFETMAHSFHEPQPVKAHAYLFRFIWMDNTDERCRSILQALKPVCVKGHTKVLIIENTIPEHGAGLMECGFDMVMMCLSSSKMRMVSQFEKLLRSEGFDMTGVYRSGPAGERCLIEAEYRG